MYYDNPRYMQEQQFSFWLKDQKKRLRGKEINEQELFK